MPWQDSISRPSTAQDETIVPLDHAASATNKFFIYVRTAQLGKFQSLVLQFVTDC
jgi:hypothetical protein